jgi:adenylosuccinate lyase
MISRYTHPEMGTIWGDERRSQTWLAVEIAAADAMAEAGIIPADAARDIRERGRFDIARIEEIERTTQHDVIAFTTAVAEHVGPAARWLHFGLTSSDVLDTALAIQMREACDLILRLMDELAAALRVRAEEHRRTPMIGRTHGVHAEPMTFGLKLALWYAEVQRGIGRIRRARDGVRVGKISGAVGTFAHLDPSIEARVCARLGLEPSPISSQVVQRDRHAELMAALAIVAASLEKFALEIRGLQKTEIGEVEEPFAKGQKGSSAMPHKRNPIGCEQICGLARLVRANAIAAMENVALWHERDISHSSVERVILPDSFIVVDHMLRRFTRIAAGMVVYPERMRENLERSRGVVFSGTVLLELARRGASREQAYDWVQRNAMRSFHERTDFKQLLLADPDVTAVLTPVDIERAFDLKHQLRHVDTLFERVFRTSDIAAEDVAIGAPSASEAPASALRASARSRRSRGVGGWQALGPQRKGKK